MLNARRADRAGVVHAIHRQRNGVAVQGVAAHGAGDGDAGAGFRRVDDVVGGDAGVQADGGRGRGEIHRVGLGVGARAYVARGVGRAHARLDGVVRVGDQVGARHVDREAVARAYRAGIRDAVDRQGDRVAQLRVSADRTGDRNVAAGFRCIDDVVGSHARRQRHRRRRRRHVHSVALGISARANVARRIRRAHARLDGVVRIGHQRRARHADREGVAHGDRAGVVRAVHVSVTVSPAAAAPPTVPVMAMLPPASAALITSSAVMFEVSVMVGVGAVTSTV